MAKPKSAVKTKKRVKRSVSDGIVHIQATFNNTVITVTDRQGNTLTWATAGASGYRGSRKSTPFAAGVASEAAVTKAIDECGMRRVIIIIKGPGPGREQAVRALSSLKIEVLEILDKSGIPHNGCRPRKKRRV